MARHSALVVFLVLAVRVTVEPPYANSPPIRSDGLGYQAWTQAILRGQLSFCSDKELYSVQAISPPQSTGRCANKYPPGLALLRFPIMAPFTATAGGNLADPAENDVDQILSIVAGAVVVLAILIGAARLGAGTWMSNVSALAMTFGSGLFHYATYDSSFTMIYSAALVAVLTVFGITMFMTDRDPTPSRRTAVKSAALLFFVGGFLVEIRLPSFLVLVTLLAAAAFLLRHERLAARRWLIVGASSIIPAVALVIAFQFTYNKATLGRWTFSSYQGEHFNLSQMQELPVLAGFYKGFLTWYPVAAVTILAAVLARQWRALVLLGGLTLPLVVLYGSWHSWSLGGGFGHRGFVEIMPIFGVVLALSFERLSLLPRVVVLLLTVVGTSMCLGLMVGYWAGTIPDTGATPSLWLDYALGAHSFPVDVVQWTTKTFT